MSWKDKIFNRLAVLKLVTLVLGILIVLVIALIVKKLMEDQALSDRPAPTQVIPAKKSSPEGNFTSCETSYVGQHKDHLIIQSKGPKCSAFFLVDPTKGQIIKISTDPSGPEFKLKIDHSFSY